MFRDFETAPSKSSYQLKFILAALALLGLLTAWIAQSRTGDRLEAVQAERTQLLGDIEARTKDVDSYKSSVFNLESERDVLKESLAASESELAGLREQVASLETQVADLGTNSTEVQSLLSAATDNESTLTSRITELESDLATMTSRACLLYTSPSPRDS